MKPAEGSTPYNITYRALCEKRHAAKHATGEILNESSVIVTSDEPGKEKPLDGSPPAQKE